MAYKIMLRNTSNNKIKTVKLGLSWTLYFFPFIVLLYRGHILYAFLSVLYNIFVFIATTLIVESLFYVRYYEYPVVQFIIVYCIFYLPFLFFGNKFSLFKYIKDGYKIVETDKEKIAMIQLKWGVGDSSFLNNEEKKIEEQVVENREFTRPSAFKIPRKNIRGSRPY